ncbi:hypothetical protein CsSME_00049335 [Camellia sinensis var. sinensis]
MGLKLNVKWGSPVQSPYHLTTSSYCPSSFSYVQLLLKPQKMITQKWKT